MHTISMILVIVSTIIIFIAITRKNSNYMNIGNVIKEQIKLLKVAPIQFIAVFITPALLSLASIFSGKIDEKLMSDLLVAVSIFFSIFFSIMGILCSISVRSDNGEVKTCSSKNGLLNETFNCVMFESTICVLLLIILLVMQLYQGSQIVSTILSFFVLYFTFLVVTNLFIIIKRLESLFNNEE